MRDLREFVVWETFVKSMHFYMFASVCLRDLFCDKFARTVFFYQFSGFMTMAFDSKSDSAGTFASSGADSKTLDCLGASVINEINYI